MRKILFDEGVPLPLRDVLTDFEVHTVQGLGWAGREDSEVIRGAEEAGYDLLVTNDKNIRHQQNRGVSGILIYELPIMNWPALRPKVDDVVRDIRSLLLERGHIEGIATDE